MSKKFTVKLGKDKTYKRPKATFQEQLSGDEIAEKLQGYIKVDTDDLAEVPIDTHMRYFIMDENGSQQFRLGGFLKNKSNSHKFVILSNGKTSWSVQVNNAVFYKKMSHEDQINMIHDLYKKKLDEKDLIIKKLKKYIKLKLGMDDPEPVKYKSTGSKSVKKSSSKSKKSTKSSKSKTGSKYSNKKY
jgi:hypothetical protein